MSEEERKLLNSIYYRLDDETELSKEESNLLLKFIKMNDKERKKLHSIIKEVREYIEEKYNYILGDDTFFDHDERIDSKQIKHILEILDKEGDEVSK